MTNVTRFGEISPLWQIFEELWQLVKSLFSIWQNQNLLWQIACAIWLIYIVVNSHNIEKVILASGHTVKKVCRKFQAEAQIPIDCSMCSKISN